MAKIAGRAGTTRILAIGRSEVQSFKRWNARAGDLVGSKTLRMPQGCPERLGALHLLSGRV
jgi:hypothetical protein